MWEDSREGIAYSEFNHHVAGVLMLFIGTSEMIRAIRATSPLWTRLLLPAALAIMGLFLLIWSDHEAWPIGPLSFRDTFWGQDYEIMQHKLYGILALTVALVEVRGRFLSIRHPAWVIPLPLFAIVGGLMLFAHSHGHHPGAEEIALHHATMGTMAIIAGSAKMVSAGPSASSPWRWEATWAALLFMIGTQLLFYTE
jgi:putative copper resistance protein D